MGVKCVSVVLFFSWGKKGKHIKTKFPGIVRKMPGQSRDSPEIIPGQSRENFVYAFSCLLFVFFFFSGPSLGADCWEGDVTKHFSVKKWVFQ